jgi:hypothetical protein
VLGVVLFSGVGEVTEKQYELYADLYAAVQVNKYEEFWQLVDSPVLSRKTYSIVEPDQRANLLISAVQAGHDMDYIRAMLGKEAAADLLSLLRHGVASFVKEQEKMANYMPGL